MTAVELRSVCRTEAGGEILRDVGFAAGSGEFVALLGPSGSGKTAVLRAVAGLDRVDSGSVWFDGEDVTGVPPERRDVALVFQEGALIPGRTARRTVEFPLSIRSVPRAEKDRRVDAEARALDIEDVIDRWPSQLSAGHRQLVEIARAVVHTPRVLLLDEPMSRLDPPTRARLRPELGLLQQGYGLTTIYAANDWREAASLADRIVVIVDGAVRQADAPEEIRRRPVSLEVAEISGPLAVLEVSVTRDGRGWWLRSDGLRIRAWADAIAGHDRLLLGLRPEGLVVAQDADDIVEMLDPAFDESGPMPQARIAGTVVPASALGEYAPGAAVPVRVGEYMLFSPSGDLLAAV
jgi:ABC-type sugar transport system ATPase subunit